MHNRQMDSRFYLAQGTDVDFPLCMLVNSVSVMFASKDLII